jgi:type II secretory pathway component HofQ
MRNLLILSSAVLLAACGGQSNEAQLEEAANQSDPAAAEVLENAAENGMDPQEALQEAGNAAAEADTNATTNSQ